MRRPFLVGDAIIVKLGNPAGHSRVPTYLRGRRGRIASVVGSFPLADDRARGIESAPQMLYTVRIRGVDVWGADADPRADVLADLWDSYLDSQT